MDHGHSVTETREPTEPALVPSKTTETTERPTKSQKEHLATLLTKGTTTQRRTTMLHETQMSTVKVLPRVKDNSSHKGLSKGVVITSSIVAVIGVITLILVAVVLVKLWKTRRKRQGNVRTVRSTTQLSFDNLSYTGEGRRDSIYQEVDMTDFEILRTRVVMSVKRKVAAFSAAGKERERDSRKISCGRLSIVETQYENTMDLGEIVQTHQI